MIFLLALVVRLVPLAASPYPYNIDGLGEAMLANGMYHTGSAAVPQDSGIQGSYIVHIPLFDMLIAAISSFVGIEPLFLIQYATAAIGAMSCVLASIVVHRITENVRISLVAGMFLALLGTYVFCTTSAWKETLGLTMLVIMAGLFLERKDIRFRALLTTVLVAIIFIHHHSAILTILVFTFAISWQCYLSMRAKRWTWENSADTLTAASLWILAISYYSVIDLPYFAFLRPDTDLYLFIAVAVVMVLFMFTVMSGKWTISRRPLLKVLIPVIAAGLILLNYFRPIFPGIPGTGSSILLFAVPYLLLVPAIWYGSESLMTRGKTYTPLLLALILAPLSMMMFGFLRGLDPTSYTVIYRTFDFLDLGLAALFGAGLIVILLKARKYAPIILAASLILIASTTPLAFQTENLFGVQNQTYEYEYNVYDLIHTDSELRNLDSDQRISASANSLFNFSVNADLAFLVEEGQSMSTDHWLIVETNWMTSGAQEFPLKSVILNESTFGEFLNSNNVIIISGPSDDQMIAAISPGQS